MLIFKWLGLLALILCGGLAGVCFAAFERKKLLQAEGFLSLLRHLRAQIDCFSMPISQIFSGCDKGVLEACGTERVPKDLGSLLRDVKLYLSEEMCGLLKDLATRLGAGYREEQLRCIDYYIARLTPYCDTLRGDLPKRERMALLLPLALCVALVLLLW